LASHAEDDGFHEIQLNGKQLVFLFMAATVVSVVIFLCGVLVGRGVRTERAAATPEGAGSPLTEITPQPSRNASGPVPAGADPTVAAPPPPVEELSYYKRLETKNPPAEDLKPAPLPAPKTAAPPDKSPDKSARASASAASAKEPPAARPGTASASRSTSTSGTAVTPASNAEPAGSGFALQIAALRERNEAEAIAERLANKGYGAYVLSPADGTPAVYRVRIGKFKTRREAETMATKLQKEEQFNPWITR